MKIVEFAFIAYPVTDLVQARAFYEGVLGLAPSSEMIDGDEFWVEYVIGPHTLAIGNERFMQPSEHGAQVVLEVGDFDVAVSHLRRAGIAFAVDPFEMPRCRAAVIIDPDGNRIGIHQRNPEPAM